MTTYIASISNLLSKVKGGLTVIQPPPTLSGAIDVIIIKQEDGTYKCGPFHVRFGKMTIFSPDEKVVDIKLNGKPVDSVHMRLSRVGHAYFVDNTEDQFDSDAESNISTDSPPPTPLVRAVSVGELNSPAYRVRRKKPRRENATSCEDLTNLPADVDLGMEMDTLQVQSDEEETFAKSIECLSDGECDKPRYKNEAAFEWEWGSFPKKCYHQAPLASATVVSKASRPQLQRRTSDSEVACSSSSAAPCSSTAGAVYLDDIEQADQSVKQAYIYPPNYRHFANDANQIDAGYKSDGETQSSQYFENPLDVKMSLCGGLNGSLFPSREDFYNHLVTFEDYRMDPTRFITNPNLVILFKDKYYNWAVAAPIIMSMVCYQNELPVNTIKRLEDTHMPKKKAARKTWFAWYQQPDLEPVAPASAHSKPIDVPMLTVTTSTDPLQLLLSRSRKRNRLTNEEIRSLNFQPGQNTIEFCVTSQYQGTTVCKASVFVWDYNDKIIVSDVDGTITRSDVLGQVLPLMPVINQDWSQKGIAKLFSHIADSGYRFIYVSSRAIGQSHMTRNYVRTVLQEAKFRLPEGPVLLNPNSLFHSIHMELISREPEKFKIQCLNDVKQLFPAEPCPLYAGFGNKINDVCAYKSVGIDSCRIFTVGTKGDVRNEFLKLTSTTYDQMFAMADHYFPVLAKYRLSTCLNIDSGLHSLTDQRGVEFCSASLKDFTSFSYWRSPSLDLSPTEPAIINTSAPVEAASSSS